MTFPASWHLAHCQRQGCSAGGWITCFEPIEESGGLFTVYPPSPDLSFIVARMAEVALDKGSDLSACLRIAHLLDRLGLEDTSLRYFGCAPHGEELRAWVEDVYLPVARTYLGSGPGSEALDSRLRAAREEALRPGTWINLKRTVAMGRKPWPPRCPSGS